MANNIYDYIAELKASDPKRANWLLDCNDVGTNSFGFIRPKLVREVIAGSHVTYDFKSAYSTNPTISPVLSRAKVSVVAIWIPISLYVPAARDGEPWKAGKTDYSLPTINFGYSDIERQFQRNLGSTGHPLLTQNGNTLPYIPANSIFTELQMWRPYYQPVGFSLDSTIYPEGKNAIPLLGYYDFFRHYVLNTQVEYFPIRKQGYSVRNSFVSGTPRRVVQEPIDAYVTREWLDNLFTEVRRDGMNYQVNGQPFDITPHISRLIHGAAVTNEFAPPKKLYVDFGEGSVPDPLSLVAFNDDHYGELRQTYMGDYYTSFLSNENVEYERSVARVVPSGEDGSITMESIYAAQRVQDFIRRTVFKNSDYAEFIEAEYSITPPTNLTKPLFLGKVSTWLTFNDVVSTAQTSDDTDVDSNSSLGSRSSLGFGRMVTGKLNNDKDRHFVSFTAREPGYFMVLEYIVPEVSYFQGFNPLYDKHSIEDLYFPSFDKSGYQDKQFKYLNEQIQNPERGFAALPPRFRFENYNISTAQELAYGEYMLTYNRMSGQMVDEGVYRHWVFHREVDPSTTIQDWMASSNFDISREDTFGALPLQTINDIYVKPEDFTHIFMNEQGLDNFQTFYRHECKIYQPLSHRFLSF